MRCSGAAAGWSLLGCNTATCVAARTLQKDWLPVSGWTGRNILGIVAPTVEAATQTPWAVTAPQYPQKYNTDVVAVFGTTRTIASHAYPEEIRKRCPQVTVVQQTCAELVGAIERGAPEMASWTRLVEQGVTGTAGADRRRAAAPRHSRAARTFRWSSTCSAATCRPSRGFCRQPEAGGQTAWRTHLNRHPSYAGEPVCCGAAALVLLTTGEPAHVNRIARIFWRDAPASATSGDVALGLNA